MSIDDLIQAVRDRPSMQLTMSTFEQVVQHYKQLEGDTNFLLTCLDQFKPVKLGDVVIPLSAPNEEFKTVIHAVQYAIDNSPVFKEDSKVLESFVNAVASRINYR